MRTAKEFITEELKLGRTYITVKATEQADESAFMTLSHAKPSFLPPITASELNGERIFNYDVTADGFKRASELVANFSPVEFITIMMNLTGALIQCRDYLLEPLNFLLDEELIFINPTSCAVRAIYLPFLDTVFTENDINMRLFNMTRSLSRRFSSAAQSPEWQEVISHLWNMTEFTTVYEANNLYTDLHSKSKGKGRVAEVQPKPPIKHSAEEPILPASEHPRPMPEEVVARQPEPDQKKRGLFGSKKKPDSPKASIFGKKPTDSPKPGLFSKKEKADKKPGLFGKKEASIVSNTALEPMPKKGFFASKEKKPKPPKKEKRPFFSKAKPIENCHTEPIDITEHVAAGGGNAILYLLERGAKTAMIPITKSEFILGRNREQVDFCLEGDNTISRVHMQISQTRGGCYITDKSSGGTMVDDKKLSPGVPEPLNYGSTIKIGRKELLFEQA